MKIRHISLENFTSHEFEQTDLPGSGIFFLDGRSGSGKSSWIIDGPQYALFGYNATRAEKQEELRHLNFPDEAMTVKVAFEFADGEKLVIERGLNGKRVSALAYDDERTLAEGPKAVDSYVRRRLGGLSWQQLYSAFVCHQEEVKGMVELKPAKRKETIHRMLGIRELELSIDEVKERLKKAGAELQALEVKIGGRTRAEAEAALAGFEAAQAAAIAQQQAVLEELERIRSRSLALETEIAPLLASLASAQKIAQLELALERRQLQLAEAQGKLARHETATAALADENTLRQELELARAELEALQAAGTRSKQHGEYLIEQAAAAERLSAAQAAALVPVPAGGATALALAASPEEMAARLQSVASERGLIERERAKRAHELECLAEQGTCFTCERPLEDGAERDSVLGTLTASLEELAERETSLAEEASATELALPAARSETQRRKAAEAEHARAEEALQQIEHRMAALAGEGEIGGIEEIRELYKAKREELRLLEQRESELGRARADLDETAAATVASLSAEQAAGELELDEVRAAALVVVDQAVLEALQSESAQLANALAGREAEQPLLAEVLLRAEAELETGCRSLSDLVELLSRRDAKHLAATRLEALSSYLAGFTKHLVAEIRPAIEEMSTEMLYQLSSGEFVAVEIDEDYKIRVQREEGNWIAPHMLSGGEKARVGVSVRLALTRLVSQRTGVPIEFIVLDEPFGNLDEELIDVAVDILGKLRDFYPQIFLISHTGDLASSQHVDYRVAFEQKKARDRVRIYQR